MTAYSWIIKGGDDDLYKEVRKIVSDLKTNNIGDDLVDQQMMVIDIISFAQSLKERASFEDKDNSKKLTKFIVAAKAKERAIMARMGG
jgi:hypothetical protein